MHQSMEQTPNPQRMEERIRQVELDRQRMEVILSLTSKRTAGLQTTVDTAVQRTVGLERAVEAVALDVSAMMTHMRCILQFVQLRPAPISGNSQLSGGLDSQPVTLNFEPQQSNVNHSKLPHLCLLDKHSRHSNNHLCLLRHPRSQVLLEALF